ALGTGAFNWNTIHTSSDFRIPLLQMMFDTLGAKKTVTGALSSGESPGPKIIGGGTLRGGFRGGRAAQLIGALTSPPDACPVSVSNWNSAGNPTIGPLDADKIFYSGTNPMDTFQNGHLGSDNESQLPTGVVPFITLKDDQLANVSRYVASVP